MNNKLKASWTHVSDDDFMANLSYNDETRNYVFSHGSYEDGEFVCTAHVFRPLSDPLDVLSGINTFFDQLGKSMKENAENSTIGSNGKLYWHSKGERGFNGNQYVKAMRLRDIGKGITKVTGPVGGFLSGCEIGNGIYQDYTLSKKAGQIRIYNTLHSTAEVVGGIVGAKIGFELGSIAGASAGNVPGGIVGGATGGIIGAIKGSELGGSLVDYFYSFGE